MYKMYKSRMKQWGDCDKHKRSSDMRFVLRKKRERDVVGKKSTFMVRNKRITGREITQYIAKKLNFESILRKQVQDPSTPDHIVCFTPSTSSDAETDNKNAREHEALFADISSYFRGSIEIEIWFLSARGRYDSVYGNTIEPLDFHILCDLAVSNFRNGLNVNGRRSLFKLCSVLPMMLREQNLRSLEIIIHTYIGLTQQGFVGSCAILQDYITKLAQSVLCDRPVWQRICLSTSLPDPGTSEIMARSWQCILDMTKRTTGLYSFESIRSETNLICQTHHTDSARQEFLLRELLTKYENGTTRPNDAGVHVADYCADAMVDQGKYSEAETLLGGSLRQAQRSVCLTRMREARSLANLAQTQYLQHKIDRAEENLRYATNLYRQEYAMDGTVARLYDRLAGWLREWGRHGEADELSDKLEGVWRHDDISVDDLPSEQDGRIL
ncbi:hypothetical protein MMC18_001280 [Xylographa bjoerkii]|nr:hypothetical protein [Xylographa bjoerkii]